MACISVTWCASSSSIGWHSQPLSKTPPTFRPIPKKVRCEKKIANMLGCFNEKCDMSPSSMDVTDATQQIATRGDFLCFSTTEVGWAVAAFGDLYKSIVKVLQIKSCQYKVNLWRLLPFLLPVVSGKRWEGCYCDWWPLCPVASLWSQICFKIQIQMRQRERYDFDWQLGFMIRFNLLPERKQYRRYVPILAIWSNDNMYTYVLGFV